MEPLLIRRDEPFVPQILPHIDEILKISDIVTDIGEKFADIIDSEVLEGKLNVSEANKRIKEMIEIQTEIAKIDEYCRIVQNLYRAKELVAKHVAQMEKKQTELEANTDSSTELDSPPLDTRLELARQQAILDSAELARARHCPNPEKRGEKKKKRRSRSLGRLIKTAVKMARRSFSSHSKSIDDYKN